MSFFNSTGRTERGFIGVVTMQGAPNRKNKMDPLEVEADKTGVPGTELAKELPLSAFTNVFANRLFVCCATKIGGKMSGDSALRKMKLTLGRRIERTMMNRITV